ncbi:MAG: hypothetical protein M1837_003209 [Sclerophora amabilis]|nr:MAG: hypothetical protein M1837_003209 [Sclerophora amabilis]
MPPRRPTTRPQTRANAQSTLSFKNKVTKPPSVSTASKKKDGSSRLSKGSTPVTSDLAIREQTKEEGEEEEAKEDEEDEDEEEKVEAAEPAIQKTEEEAKAEQMSDAQLKRYWRAKESERKAPRVHQQDLSTNEKILRHFDLSSQYGPCIGIPRLSRWTRAQTLNLSPPIEVLAVLLKEEAKGPVDAKKIQRAYVDELMGGRVGVVE